MINKRYAAEHERSSNVIGMPSGAVVRKDYAEGARLSTKNVRLKAQL
jgi:hypothetical protein